MSNLINDIGIAAEALKSGKIGIFPTDTAFGIGCRMDDVDAVERVYKVRNRPHEKALLILVSSVDMAREYVEIGDEIEKTMQKYWPGGLTAIFKCKKEKVPANVRAGGDTLAIRLPDHKNIRAMIEKIGVPIVAPSANKSGKDTPYKFDDIDPELLAEVDFFMNGVCTMEGVSTIIDTTQVPIKVVRQGVVDFELS